MSINISSEAECRKAYLNYHCYGNSMGISAEEMGKITQAWDSKLSSWQASVSSDENEYEFDDSEYANYKSEGKNAAKDAAGGYSGKTGGQWTRAVGDGVASAGGVFLNTVGSGIATNIAQRLGGKTLGTAMGKAANKITEKAGEGAGDKATQNQAWIVAAPLALAIATAYMAKKPNKEAKEACDALQTEMTGAQATLEETQGEMETMAEEIIELSDKALTNNEDANDEIEDQKSEYDMYYQTFMTIQSKIESGEPLTQSEKDLYEAVIGYLNEIGISIEELSQETTDVVAELYEEMGTYQDGYDNAAETMGEIEGLTDYAASFDSVSRDQSYALACAMSANAAASGVLAGFLFADMNIFTKTQSAIMGGIATAAGVSNGLAAYQQFDWAGKIGQEIDLRKATQDLNSNTMDMYDEEIDAYDGWMQGVEDLELEIPDDVAPVEGTPIPTDGANNDGNSGGENNSSTGPVTGSVDSSTYANYADVVQGNNQDPSNAPTSNVVTANPDGTGQVVLSQEYATAICNALGLPVTTTGPKFNSAAIPKIIANLIPGFSENDIKTVMNGGKLQGNYDASLVQTLTGDDTGKDENVDISEKLTDKLKIVINFYNPIFTKAAQQGWKC